MRNTNADSSKSALLSDLHHVNCTRTSIQISASEVEPEWLQGGGGGVCMNIVDVCMTDFDDEGNQYSKP